MKNRPDCPMTDCLLSRLDRKTSDDGDSSRTQAKQEADEKKKRKHVRPNDKAVGKQFGFKTRTLRQLRLLDVKKKKCCLLHIKTDEDSNECTNSSKYNTSQSWIEIKQRKKHRYYVWTTYVKGVAQRDKTVLQALEGSSDFDVCKRWRIRNTRKQD